MKKNVKKLKLHRETLRALDGRRLQQAAGGGTDSDCMCTDYSAVCPTHDTDVYSCDPNCPQTFPTAGSCNC